MCIYSSLSLSRALIGFVYMKPRSLAMSRTHIPCARIHSEARKADLVRFLFPNELCLGLYETKYRSSLEARLYARSTYLFRRSCGTKTLNSNSRGRCSNGRNSNKGFLNYGNSRKTLLYNCFQARDIYIFFSLFLDLESIDGGKNFM